MKLKKQLFLSIISLLLSISMLTGTTFAWFSDSVISSGNIIQSGNLNVDFYWSDDLISWQSVEGSSLFDSERWEPGQTHIKYIKIANSGDLAFRYALNLISSNTESDLSDVIDVYFGAAPTSPLSSFTELKAQTEKIGTLSDLYNSSIIRGALLPEGSESDVYSVGSEIFTLALHMQDDLDSEYQGKILGRFKLLLEATQLSFEQDSFGNDYDSDTLDTPTVTNEIPLVPEATEALPSAGIAQSTGVNFATAPYAYNDTSRFAGKRITKIGIPVKTVDTSNGAPVFTLSVVKTNSTAYEYVAQYRLKLDTLARASEVNDWIYVDLKDLNIVLGMDETLAFGAPDDTVNWGYLPANLGYKYSFRAVNGNWNQIHTSSILFDVYTEETLVFENTEQGKVATFDSPIFENVLEAFPGGAIASGNSVEFTNPPYAYTNSAKVFEGKTLTKIGIPVKTVKALDENQTFTLSVVRTDVAAYDYVAQYKLKLPLSQLGNSTTVNRWVYVDLSDLNITIKENETLAFGATDDTVSWGWKSGYNDSTYFFRAKNQNWSAATKSIFFDVYAEETLTYEDYLNQLREEEERLEAEKIRLENEAKLKDILSGKKISILGDSISTFAGYSNNTSYNNTIGGNAIWYNGSNYITNVNETWWMQAINRTGMTLNVNNSWSGDTVTGRGVARALELDNNDGVDPDIIAVYLGINDFRTKVTAENFATAYTKMIEGIKAKYPDAEVYLFTLVYTTNVNSGVNPDDVVKFNAAIEDIATKTGCTVVDLYNDSGINKTTFKDNMCDATLHPNYAGMDRITQCFIDVLVEKYVKQ